MTTAFLIATWILLIIASYKVSLKLLEKTGQL